MTREMQMITGKVKWYDISKGLGYIRPDEGGGDVLVRRDKLLNESAQLHEGQQVQFGVQTTESGRAAAVNLVDFGSGKQI